jgi:hypothetical protein
MTHALRVLDADEIQEISGGFVCGGLCILSAIGAGLAFFTAGLEVGEAVGKH